MRKLKAFGLCTLLVLFGAASAFAGANETNRRDPGDAWPWGAELPFPWKGIQGVWSSVIDGEEVFISFRTVRSASAMKQLQITEYTADCNWISRGAGYEQEERVVNAVMVYRNGRSFNMTVHVFRQADLKHMKSPEYVEVPGAKTVTVMNMGTVGGKMRETHQLYKINSNPTSICPSLFKSESIEY